MLHARPAGTIPAIQIDPELRRQLERAQAAAEPISAESSLATTAEGTVLPPEETERRVNDLVRRVELEVGDAPQRFRIRKNIGTFSVTATPAFIQKLAEQRDVATATASRQSEGRLIKPVSTTRLPGSDRET